MRKKIVAIVGRPNTGKSTLFNRICRKRKAIVDFTEGVTRDRKYEEVEWNGRCFIVVDTGGIVPNSDDPIDKQIRLQAEIAIQEADLIVFLTDAQTGVTGIDAEIAKILRPVGDKVILAANKTDNEKIELDLYDFLQLGFSDAIGISAISGRNTGNFLDLVLKHIPDTAKVKYDDEKEEHDDVRIALVGKPNVGKSSIINRLVGKDTVIVTDIAGTTRDSVDTTINYKQKKLTFIDTAGLRRKRKIKYGVEYFSTVRTMSTIDQADVVVLVIDATEGVTNQDQKIASYAHRRYKDLIIAVNKWDLIEDKNSLSTKNYQLEMSEELPFLAFAPVKFISALTNQRVHLLLELILEVEEESKKRIPTAKLNEFLQKVMQKYAPMHASGKHAKIYYCTQRGVHPPEIVFFCNDAKLITKNYRRYIHNQLREAFDFKGATIKLNFRGRDKDAGKTIIEY